MKRRVLIGLAVVLAVLVALATPVVMAFTGNTPLEPDTTLVSGATLIVDGFVASYMFSIGEKEVALIDCGADPEGKAIRAQLSKRGLDNGAVKQIFLTHSHRDHVGGCALFPKAIISAMPEETARLEGHPDKKSVLERVFGAKDTGVRITQPLSDTAIVTVGDRSVQAFLVPGHTPGSAVFLVDGVLYFGDSASAGTGNTLRPAVGLFSVDSDQNKASLLELAKRVPNERVKQLAFGHSGPSEPQLLQAFAP